MNVAIVIPTEWRAKTFTTDPRLLVQGFDQLGHSATIVCLTGSTPAEGSETLLVDYPTLTSPGFWRSTRFDLVVVFTWMHGHNAVLAAATRSGAFVVSKGDTDGNYSARAQPIATLRYAFFSAPSLTPRARNLWYWAKRLGYLDQAYTRPIVQNIEQSHATVVETNQARKHVLQILRMQGRDGLASKVHVVPTAVAEAFCYAGRASTVKDEPLVYSVGRWRATQKNGRLLASVLRSFLRADGRARAIVVGSGSANLFEGFELPQISTAEHLDQQELASIAARARIFLVSSRWEGCHISAHEAAAAGTSVVGTPIPAVDALAGQTGFGAVSRSHRKRDVVHALRSEMDAWDRGQRSRSAIAEHWRARLAPCAVTSRLLELGMSAEL